MPEGEIKPNPPKEKKVEETAKANGTEEQQGDQEKKDQPPEERIDKGLDLLKANLESIGIPTTFSCAAALDKLRKSQAEFNLYPEIASELEKDPKTRRADIESAILSAEHSYKDHEPWIIVADSGKISGYVQPNDMEAIRKIIRTEHQGNIDELTEEDIKGLNLKWLKDAPKKAELVRQMEEKGLVFQLITNDSERLPNAKLTHESLSDFLNQALVGLLGQKELLDMGYADEAQAKEVIDRTKTVIVPVLAEAIVAMEEMEKEKSKAE
ncbi:hypothetical protein HQ544_04410 [Candidatus Falkowbacteria bacterium]|nr:hypothetical protein [Candidatus Falkowbacteria bacterium]